MKLNWNLPPLNAATGSWPQRRQELTRLLEQELYGALPEHLPLFTQSEETQATIDGHPCRRFHLTLHAKGQHGEHRFPLFVFLPEGKGPFPVCLNLAFDPEDAMDAMARGQTCYPGGPLYPPLGDFLGRGRGLALLFAQGVEPDDKKTFPCALGKAIAGPDRGEHTPGCLAVWAMGLRLAAQALFTEGLAQPESLTLAGFSRMGKAALWAAALEDQAACAASFQSGCGGAALSCAKGGETLTQMMDTFPHWLALSARKYHGKEQDMPFDQHMLLALAAPRPLFVASASEDAHSDPQAELLACLLAGQAWHAAGAGAMSLPGDFPSPGTLLAEGSTGYYLRGGPHSLTPDDWAALLGFLEERGL